MDISIEPGRISGLVQVPASKSVTQRVLAAALLGKGKTTVSNAGKSADELAALRTIVALGARVTEHTNGDLLIESTGIISAASRNIDVGESGLSARLFAPIAALSKEPVTISGNGTLLKRPMTQLISILEACAVTVTSSGSFLPITVSGPVATPAMPFDGSAGSQAISGALFALCAAAKEKTSIQVINATSRPYLDLSLQVLNGFGWAVTHEDYKTFHLAPVKKTRVKELTISVEGDWSSAAALMVAAALQGKELQFANLREDSLQADRMLLPILQRCGVQASWTTEGILTLKPSARLKVFSFDATDSPDLFPALALLAAGCEGESIIKGLHRLQHKESDRSASVSALLTALGVPHRIDNDLLVVRGKKKFTAATVDSFHDHRIAMVAAAASVRAGGAIKILNAEAVDKSYPSFFTDLQSLGARLQP